MSRLLVIFVSLLLVLSAAPAQAAQPAKLTYQIYAGGVHVVEANLTLDQQATRYQTSLTAYTRGFLGKLVPWKGSFATTGSGSGANMKPREHKSVSTWKGSDDIALYRYDAKGQFESLKLTDDGQDKTPKEIDPKLTRDTIDVLTATLRVMHNAKGSKACAGKADVFDSRRRFTLTFTPQGNENLKPSDYNVYQGQAMKCTVEVTPKGGAWKKKPRGWLSIQEQGRKKGTLPTLWFASVDPKLPPVPVKIMVKTDYGTLFMHLAQINVNGKTVTPPR